MWSKDDAEPYSNALGPGSRLLITTRDAALEVLGRLQRLDVLDDAEAIELLARSSGNPLDGLPPKAKEVAEECGNLPLALAMIGALVHGNADDRWDHYLRRLRTLKLDKIKFPIPNYEPGDLMAALQVSVDDLEREQQARYLELAVFSPGATIPEKTLRVLYEPAGVDPDDVTDLVDLYVRRSLARRSDPGCIILHDLQSDYVRARTPDLAAVHGRLLDAYAKHCPNGWPTGPDDGYFFQFVPYHLDEAGRQQVLSALLLNYRWLDAKLRATNVINLIADYDRLPDNDETRLVQRALQLAGTGLASDKPQLRTQLYTRLLPFKQGGLVTLVEDARQALGPWIRPLVPTLTLPGGPLIRTLTGHEDFVDAIVIFDEGRRAISVSHDQTARVWDLDRGTEIMKLSGERDGVTAVAVTSGGERAVIVSSNYTFEVWDLKEGKKLRTFDGHRAEIHALIITPDNRFVISGGADSTIKIWDLESGTLAGSLEGHSNNVAALAITPDGQTLLSGSWDGKIGLWDLADRKLLRFLPAHEKWIIGLLCDSEYVVSASGDNTVKIWNIATGEQLSMLTGFHFYSSATRPMALCPSGSCLVLGGSDGEIAIWDLGKGSAWLLEEGHTAWVCAVDVFPDNQRAISASGDKTIKIWNLHATRRDQRPAHEYFVTKLIVKPDGKEAVSASPRDGLKVWDLRTLELIKSIPIPPPDGGPPFFRDLGGTHESPVRHVDAGGRFPRNGVLPGRPPLRLGVAG